MIEMYAIIIYDAESKRVTKYLKLLRRYLHHVQNSAFEGEITAAKLKELQGRLQTLNTKNEDSIIIYTFHNSKYTKRVEYGPKQGLERNIL